MARWLAYLALSPLALLTLPQDGWELDLSTPAPVDADLSGPLEGFKQHACAECHATIAAEWAQTLHAQAWVDPRYKKGLKGKRRKKSCYGCHVPEPLHLAAEFGRKPAPRADEGSRHFGIDCKSCHLGPEETVLGPWGEETDAHASTKSEHFVGTGSNELCITCHRTNIGPVIGVARDFEEADLGARGMSCVGCHMAPVERPAAIDSEGRPTRVRTGRSHLLQTPRDPEFLAQAFALEARDEAGTTVITIRNRAGHRLPGLMGRSICFHVPLLGGSERDFTMKELWIDDTAYLPVEGTVEMRIEGARDNVVIQGTHNGPHLDDPQVFLERELPVRR